MGESPFGDRSYIILTMAMKKFGSSKHSLRLAGAAALVALAIGAVACGTDTTTPVDPPAATLTAVPTATAVPTPTGGAASALTGWRTDLATGSNVGEVAPNPSVLLRDGSMATLEEVAAGKPMVLYFFATW